MKEITGMDPPGRGIEEGQGAPGGGAIHGGQLGAGQGETDKTYDIPIPSIESIAAKLLTSGASTRSFVQAFYERVGKPV